MDAEPTDGWAGLQCTPPPAASGSGRSSSVVEDLDWCILGNVALRGAAIQTFS